MTPKRTDSNQQEIVAFLRQLGATVTPTHMVSHGFPDVCVGWQGENFLLEIKDGNKPPSARKLTAEELIWHNLWKGQVAIVKDCDEALAVLNGKIKRGNRLYGNTADRPEKAKK